MAPGNDTLVNTLMYYTDAGSRIKDLDLSLLTVAQASQSAVAQIISGAQLPQQFQAAFINAVNTAPGATTMSTLLSQTIVNVSLSILSFLICFLGCYIVASFLIHLICYVFELPVLRHLDALMGGVFGLARGVLLLFIFFALVPIIQAVVPVQQLTDVFTASRLAPLFDSQIILSILGA
ncbi:MAG: CvpA family protein [Christensenellales bacterium]